MLYNRTRRKAEELAAGGGAEVVDSLEELARKSSVVITMLPGPPEVREVFAGEGGLLEGAGRRTLLVDMSTSSPLLARELAEAAGRQGIRVLDAPVSGGDVGAEEGTLSIMVGGQERDFDEEGTGHHIGSGP